MVGFLTGVTRTPFTSAILVLEMTDRHSVIFYLMLAAMLSYLAAMAIRKHSFYDQLKRSYLVTDRPPAANQVNSINETLIKGDGNV
jgi:H+/Cl- antiporter ClcA